MEKRSGAGSGLGFPRGVCILSSYKAKAQVGWELVWVVVRRACVHPLIILALVRS